MSWLSSTRSGRTIHLENELMDVNVIPVPEPVVHISGTSDISREYEDFKLGVRIFADVHIVMTTGSPTGNGNNIFCLFCFVFAQFYKRLSPFFSLPIQANQSTASRTGWITAPSRYRHPSTLTTRPLTFLTIYYVNWPFWAKSLLTVSSFPERK